MSRLVIDVGHNMRHFTVWRAPQGKERPRVVNGRAYTPERTREAEEVIQWAYRTQVHQPPYPPHVPLCVWVEAIFAVPKSCSKKDALDRLEGRVLPCRKPDADNVGKLILDALNGLAWHDDAQIVGLTIIKRYGETECMRVSMWTNDGEVDNDTV